MYMFLSTCNCILGNSLVYMYVCVCVCVCVCVVESVVEILTDVYCVFRCTYF